MTVHFQREIDRLKQHIIALGALVEERVNQAVRSVLENDQKLAQEVIAGDDLVDHAEVELEEECLKVLALHQPVATDLRFIVAVLKINNDLERIGDLAVNIAQRAEGLGRTPSQESIPEILTMAEKTKWMLRESLRSFVSQDGKAARQICSFDRQIDELNRAIYTNITRWIMDEPAKISVLLLQLSVSKHLERIADHATNIAEDVIYLIEGQIVRHRADSRINQR